jgi:hypothetical protein
MIACLIAGVTSAETIMVVGSAVFTRNCYLHLAPGRSERHYLWVGRIASGGTLLASAVLAALAGSVMQLFFAGVDIVALLGPAFWLGVVWRRANAAGAWASFVGGLLAWAAFTLSGLMVTGRIATSDLLPDWVLTGAEGIDELGRARQIGLQLGVEFGLLILVSLVTRPQRRERLDPFFARLLTPVGREADVCSADKGPWQASGALDAATAADAGLGLDGPPLDYSKASAFGNSWLRPLGLEVPRLNWIDWGGFVAAWAIVAGMIGLLAWLARLGA